MAKKENDATYILDSKKGLPNKLLQADGTTTDMLGNVVVNPDSAWDSKPALPNKWLNPDGTYSTLNEIIAGMVDTGIYVIVDELPSEGNPQKIYLVPDGKGGFVEYHWTGSKWDPIGTIDIDLSNYSTTQEMMNAIEAAGILTLNSAKTYTDEQIAGISANSQIFYWDGTNSSDAIALWNQIYQISQENDVIVISFRRADDLSTPIVYPIKKQMDLTQNIRGIANARKNVGASHTDLYLPYYTVRCVINNEQVTNIMINKSEEQTPLLESNFNYFEPYEPQYPGSPATKKYVDDSFLNLYVNIPAAVMQLTDESTPEEIFAAFGGKQKLQDIIVELRKGKYAYFVNINEEYIEDEEQYGDEQPHLEIGSSFTFITRYSIDGVSPDMIEIILDWRDQVVHSIMFLGVGYEDDELTIISDENVGINRVDLAFVSAEDVLLKGNTTPFTPTENYDPATKKYVDDCIETSITDVLNTSY